MFAVSGGGDSSWSPKMCSAIGCAPRTSLQFRSSLTTVLEGTDCRLRAYRGPLTPPEMSSGRRYIIDTAVVAETVLAPETTIRGNARTNFN